MEEIFEKMPVITSDEIPASDNLVQKTCRRQQDSTNIFFEKKIEMNEKIRNLMFGSASCKEHPVPEKHLLLFTQSTINHVIGFFSVGKITLY